MNLKKLLQPKTVAIIGASEKEGFGGDTCRNIIEYTKNMKNTFLEIYTGQQNILIWFDGNKYAEFKLSEFKSVL